MLVKTAAVRTATYQIIDGDVRNVVNQFLIAARSRSLSPATITFYTRYLEVFCQFLDDQEVKMIDELNADIIRNYLLHLEDLGHNPGGIHGHYRCVRALLGWCEEEMDGEYRSPMRKVKPPKLQIKPLPGIQLENVLKMVDQCDNRLGIRDQAILLVLTDTGARRAEFVYLNVADVDLYSGETRILRAKGGKFRSVFLGDRSRRALKKYLRTRPNIRPESPLFISEDGSRITFDGLKSVIRRRAAAVGIKAPGLHDFRRCFAITMKRNGADVVTISRMLGHASLEVTKRYLAQDTSDFKTAHERYGPIDNADQGR